MTSREKKLVVLIVALSLAVLWLINQRVNHWQFVVSQDGSLAYRFDRNNGVGWIFIATRTPRAWILIGEGEPFAEDFLSKNPPPAP